MRFVRFTRFGLRQAFGFTAVDCLPKDSLIAIAIRLERNLAIGIPCWKTIAPSKRETPNRRLAGQVIGPDGSLITVIDCEGDTSAVRRHTWSLVRSGRKVKGIDSSATVRDADVRALRALQPLERRHGIRNVDESAVLGKAELSSASSIRRGPAEAFQHLHRLACQRWLLCIERNSEQAAAKRVNKMTGGYEPGVAAALEIVRCSPDVSDWTTIRA